MMLVVVFYFEVFGDLDVEFKNYFCWVSLIFVIFVLFYLVFLFYLNVWCSICGCILGMDVFVFFVFIFVYIVSLVVIIIE